NLSKFYSSGGSTNLLRVKGYVAVARSSLMLDKSRHSSGDLVISAPQIERDSEVLTAAALEFLAALHKKFDATRRHLLAARPARQKRFDAGEMPDFLPETRAVRDGAWTIGTIPPDLIDRRVEITGPVDRKMIINALNSGAKVFMADFEDANSPSW